MVFVIAPGNRIKVGQDWKEYQDILAKLQNRAILRGQDIWLGYTFGGIEPLSGQFGIASIRPRDIFGGGTATFVKSYGSQGSWANIWSYTVPLDLIHAFAGIAIPDPTLIFSQIRFELQDRRFPIVDIEEAHVYPDGFSIIFKQDDGEEFIIPEKQRVLLKGFQERGTRGMTQRVVPLGFALFRNFDLYITERETSN